MISSKYPDKMAILKKQNVSFKEENVESVDTDSDIETNYFSSIKFNTLCKISRRLFTDNEMGYCSNNDVVNFRKKK